MTSTLDDWTANTAHSGQIYLGDPVRGPTYTDEKYQQHHMLIVMNEGNLERTNSVICHPREKKY